VPPYHLVPQSTNDLKIAVATLTGTVLEVVSAATVSQWPITVKVEDSHPSPWRRSSTINVRVPAFAPPFSASFHTFLAGAAPGLTMTARSDIGVNQIETIEMQLQNVGLEVGRLVPGEVRRRLAGGRQHDNSGAGRIDREPADNRHPHP
jgi:hypothetical protein